MNIAASSDKLPMAYSCKSRRGRTAKAILKNIFAYGEMVEDSVISILETTAADGKNYQTRYYNLDVIIAVGYRVNSYQTTQFRLWPYLKKMGAA